MIVLVEAHAASVIVHGLGFAAAVCALHEVELDVRRGDGPDVEYAAVERDVVADVDLLDPEIARRGGLAEEPVVRGVFFTDPVFVPSEVVVVHVVDLQLAGHAVARLALLPLDPERGAGTSPVRVPLEVVEVVEAVGDPVVVPVVDLVPEIAGEAGFGEFRAVEVDVSLVVAALGNRIDPKAAAFLQVLAGAPCERPDDYEGVELVGVIALEDAGEGVPQPLSVIINIVAGVGGGGAEPFMVAVREAEEHVPLALTRVRMDEQRVVGGSEPALAEVEVHARERFRLPGGSEQG